MRFLAIQSPRTTSWPQKQARAFAGLSVLLGINQLKVLIVLAGSPVTAPLEACFGELFEAEVVVVEPGKSLLQSDEIDVHHLVLHHLVNI